MKSNKIKLTILAAFSLFLISGCSSSPEVVSVSAASSMIREALKEQRVEIDKIKEPEVALLLLADSDVNSQANINKSPSNAVPGTPTSIKVFELTDDSMLLSADQESLNKDIDAALGKTYLNHSDFVITPGEFKFVDFEKIHEKTRFIGVVANYRNTNKSTWKQVIKLDPKDRKQALFIHLTQQAVFVRSED
jgi:type VI secretion system VasD/TssJ family lipoprotein